MAGRVFDITKEWPLGDIEKMLNSPGICSYRFVPKSPPQASPQERLHSVWSVKTELLSWLVSCDSSIFIQTKRADRTKGVCWVCKRGRVKTPNVFFADPVYLSRVLVHWRTGLLHHYKRHPDSELQKSQLTCVSVLQWIFTSLTRLTSLALINSGETLQSTEEKGHCVNFRLLVFRFDKKFRLQQPKNTRPICP